MRWAASVKSYFAFLTSTLYHVRWLISKRSARAHRCLKASEGLWNWCRRISRRSFAVSHSSFSFSEFWFRWTYGRILVWELITLDVVQLLYLRIFLYSDEENFLKNSKNRISVISKYDSEVSLWMIFKGFWIFEIFVEFLKYSSNLWWIGRSFKKVRDSESFLGLRKILNSSERLPEHSRDFLTLLKSFHEFLENS